jgi:signal transduction histidine kinase
MRSWADTGSGHDGAASRHIMKPPMDTLVDRLAQQHALAGLPHHELEWLAAHGTIERYDAGVTVSSADEATRKMAILLVGTLAIYVDRGGARRKVMEWKEGDITGVLPYSRMDKGPGDVVSEAAAEILSVPQSAFPEMIRECPELVARLVHLMLDRARHFTSYDLRDEKMKSLGRLSAGLAHELNNPASAAERSAAGLIEQLGALDEAARALGAMRLSSEQLAVVDAVRTDCEALVRHEVRSTIDQADREDAIADWLEAHGVGTDVAHALAESSVSFQLLDRLGSALKGPALEAALGAIAAGCTTRALATEIESAVSRIHDLVGAMKGFSYMDQAAARMPVDLSKNLADTLAVHQWKAKRKSIAVTVSVDPDLPTVVGVGGELNQVWSNLLDNALDAAPEEGRVTVTATRHGSNVAVSVADDGPGIPDELRARIFDPFFTTKPVGSGTGLGLDIVRRIVDSHGGDLVVDSRPGRTVFTVTLPISRDPS